MRINRERTLSGEGTALFGLQPEAAGRLEHRRVRLAPGAIFLIASDGFSALAELYHRFTPAELVAAACLDGLEALARELRRIESEVDPDGTRYPRFKPSDDATALLLQSRP
jgi:hypothetical protein